MDLPQVKITELTLTVDGVSQTIALPHPVSEAEAEALAIAATHRFWKDWSERRLLYGDS